MFLNGGRGAADDAPLLPHSKMNTYIVKKTSLRVEYMVSRISVALNIVLLALIAYTSLLPSGGLMRHPESYSPAYEAVDHVPVVFRVAFLNDSSPYQGWPDDNKDQLWQDMYSKGMSVRIQQAAARRLINATERIAKPGMEKDYVVGLDVFHQLHCLNMLRQAIYPRRYNSSIIRADGTVDFLAWSHLDHCVESLRESLTCSADISAIPYRWMPASKIMVADLRGTHLCRDFARIRDWAFARSAPVGSARRAHVEGGVVVDYAGTGRDPERLMEEKLARPEGWDKTAADL